VAKSACKRQRAEPAERAATYSRLLESVPTAGTSALGPEDIRDVDDHLKHLARHDQDAGADSQAILAPASTSSAIRNSARIPTTSRSSTGSWTRHSRSGFSRPKWPRSFATSRNASRLAVVTSQLRQLPSRLGCQRMNFSHA
jgi:hypothetical protein